MAKNIKIKKPFKPELVAPAGNLEKLKTAFAFGADAAYLGGPSFSLRVHADNFSFPEIKKAVLLAEKLDKKTYLAVNSYLFDHDLKQMKSYLKKIKATGMKTLIISDLGLLSFIRDHFPSFRIHISTQASTTNSEAVRMYSKLGASRIILARELDLKKISAITKACPEIEVETFIHGAMCIAYSGRCLMSDYFTSRSANRGDCSHTCRWQYEVIEEKRPDEIIPIEQDKNGTYIMSSKDLNMANHIDDLYKAGISALKIEGRMKSLYYVAVTSAVYRQAIDSHIAKKVLDKNLLEELEHVSHRPYHTGFFYGAPSQVAIKDKNYIREFVFLGTLGEKNRDGFIKINLKNPFSINHKVEVFEPGAGTFFLDHFELYRKIPVSNEYLRTDMVKIQEDCYLKSPLPLRPFSILRLRT